MRDLVGRAFALDPETGAAVQVIAYFDALAEARAGLEVTVRGVAALAQCPARFVDADRRLRVRVRPDGLREEPGPIADPTWPGIVVGGGTATLTLEREGTVKPMDALVLERAAGVLRDILDRVWGTAPGRPPHEDTALVEVLLDPSAAPPARLRAARTLGLDPDAPARVVAAEGGVLRIEPAGPATGDTGPRGTRPRAAARPSAPPRGDTTHGTGRVGIGPEVPVLDLPHSRDLARIALRLAADGTEQDPGPRVVRADDLGGLVTLVRGHVPGTPPLPDVEALDRTAAVAPWAPATLHATAYAASMRAAAEQLNVHHSTLQDRIAHAERLLGWNTRTAHGRLRLQLALTLRHLHRTAEPAGEDPSRDSAGPGSA